MDVSALWVSGFRIITVNHYFEDGLLNTSSRYKILEKSVRLTHKLFFAQVCEGLAFLHDSVKMIHRNISLGCIILNEAGAWKIFGFDFCLQNVAPVGQSTAWNFPIADQMQPASEFGLPGKNNVVSSL